MLAKQLGGSGSMLSDLFHAVTRGNIKGHWIHPNSYYAKHDYYRQLEVWANMISIVGESHFGVRLMERLTPNMYRMFKQELETLAGPLPKA